MLLRWQTCQNRSAIVSDNIFLLKQHLKESDSTEKILLQPITVNAT